MNLCLNSFDILFKSYDKTMVRVVSGCRLLFDSVHLNPTTLIGHSPRFFSSQPSSGGSEEENRGSVVIKRRGLVALLGINRPNENNTLDLATVQGLDTALTDLEQDPSVRVVVLYGERGNFCSGYDLDSLERDPDMIQSIKKVGLTERYSKLPIVAAIAGYAQGPGFELALWADFRIVEESAVLGAFAKNQGVPFGVETARKFVRLVGLSKAMDWMLTGRVVKSKEALESGVATRLVAIGTGVGQGYNLACGLANMPQSCLRADRAALYLAAGFHSPQTQDFLLAESHSATIQALQESKGLKDLRCEDGDVRKKPKQVT